MNKLILMVFTIALTGCGTSKKATSKHESLDGTWIPVKQVLAGKDLPTVVFENYKLTITDSIYTYGSDKVDKGVAKYKNGKMDLYGKEGVNIGKHFTAIYKLENGELTVCYNLAGDSYPNAFETTSKPTLFMSVFKKKIP